MNREEKEAQNALMRLAALKAKKYEKPVRDIASVKMKQLGVDPDTVGSIAGAATLLSDINGGRPVGVDLGDNFRLEGKNSDKEKMLKLLYNKRF